MARLPAWADDANPQAFAGAPPRGGRVKTVLLGLSAIAVATFAAGYYLPLYRAHEQLSGEHRALGQKVQTLEASLAQTRAELDAVTKKKSELELERSGRESAEQSRRQKLDSVKNDLSTKLDKHVSKGSAVVSVAGERVLVALNESLVFAPKKTEVSARGKALLCDVAKAAGAERSLAVGAVNKDLPPGEDSAWAFTAERAASAAETLADKCAVAGARLRAVGRASFTPASRAELGKLPNRLELEIAAPDAKP